MIKTWMLIVYYALGTTGTNLTTVQHLASAQECARVAEHMQLIWTRDGYSHPTTECFAVIEARP